MPPDRQPASIVSGELELLPRQLEPNDPILVHQIRDRLAILAIRLAGQDGQHHLERGRVDHGWSHITERRWLLGLGRPHWGYDGPPRVTRPNLSLAAAGESINGHVRSHPAMPTAGYPLQII
jgi:hypothetical protein